MNRDLTIEELASELEALREAPSQEFAGRLDARAAAGFPRRGSQLLQGSAATESLRRIARRARENGPRRPLLPALAGLGTAVLVATAVVVSTDGGGSSDDGAQPETVAKSAGGQAAPSGAAAGAPNASKLPSSKQTFDQVGGAVRAQQGGAGVIAPEPTVPGQLPAPGPGTAPGVRDRQVERSAEMTLGTDPDQVQDVSGKVIGVVGRYRGFVLSSSVRDGTEGDAGASFELLIPSARLSPALADLSGIAEVRSRSENTLDITAPYVSAREHLRDARAEAEGLLRQLAAADTDAERASVKAQLEVVRGRIAAFRTQVDRLQRRGNFSRVSLDVVTGKAEAFPGSGGNDWTIGDALRDAGRVLAVAAGVVLLGAALFLPIGLLGAAFWGARRIYLRRARAATLSAQS